MGGFCLPNHDIRARVHVLPPALINERAPVPICRPSRVALSGPSGYGFCSGSRKVAVTRVREAFLVALAALGCFQRLPANLSSALWARSRALKRDARVPWLTRTRKWWCTRGVNDKYTPLVCTFFRPSCVQKDPMDRRKRSVTGAWGWERDNTTKTKSKARTWRRCAPAGLLQPRQRAYSP